MAFQGTAADNHLQKTSASGLADLDATQTICAWMYIPSYATTQSAIGVIRAAAAAIQIGPREGGVTAWGWGGSNKITGPATYTSTWFHMAWTFSGGQNYLYYNGSLAAGPNTGTQQTGTPDQVFFSGYDLTNSETFTGLLDDVRFYNRALSVGEIQSIYYTMSKDGIEYGLISRWVFNELPPGQQIATAVDLAGRNNLVPVGAGASPSVYVDSIITSKRAIRNCY